MNQRLAPPPPAIGGKGFFKLYAARLRLFSPNIRLFILGVFLAGLGFTFWQLLFNLYLQAAGYSNAAIGDMLTVGNLAMAVAALPAGYLAGRLRPKRQLITAQLLSSAAFTAAALVESSSLLFVFFGLAFGLSAFVRVVSGPFVMRHSTPVERTYIFATLFIFMLAGGVVGNAAAGLIKDAFILHHWPPLVAYRTTLLIGVGASYLGIIPFLFIRSQPARADDERPLSLRGFRDWNWRLFAKAMLPQALLAVGAGLIVQFVNLYFKDVFDEPDYRIGYFLSAQSVTMVLGIALSPALAEKFGKVRTIVASQLSSLPFMLILAFTTTLPLAVAAFIMRAALMNMSAPLANTLVLELCPKEQQGILQALFITNWALAWALSAFLFGQVLNADYSQCFLVAAGLYVLSSALYYLFFRHSEKPGQSAISTP